MVKHRVVEDNYNPFPGSKAMQEPPMVWIVPEVNQNNLVVFGGCVRRHCLEFG